MKTNLGTKIARLTGSSMLALASLKIASLGKFSWIVGSSWATFSGTSVVMPLVGAFGGMTTSFLVCLVKMLGSGSLALHMLAFHLPGLCAALSWRSSSFLLHVVLPLVCFTAFVVHPVGGQAFLYACYWFIPVILFHIPRQSVYTQALASTFIAHAVGSIIWLYTVPMSATAWLALIPVVAVERLVCAAGMVVVYTVITWCERIIFGVLVPRYKLPRGNSLGMNG